VSIVRQGLAEDKKFGDGYEAIFGKGKAAAKKPAAKKPAAKKATAKKPAAKKATAKKK
jgi:hypothetical protein